MQKLIWDVLLKAGTIRLLEKKIREYLHDLELGKDLNSKKAITIRGKNYNNQKKKKNLGSSKDTVKRTKRQATDWEKIFTKPIIVNRLHR